MLERLKQKDRNFNVRPQHRELYESARQGLAFALEQAEAQLKRADPNSMETLSRVNVGAYAQGNSAHVESLPRPLYNRLLRKVRSVAKERLEETGNGKFSIS
jgi:hypothetical protein